MKVARRISVLIPAFNEQEMISATIDSINRSFEELSWPDFEILVCDNNSTDETSRIAREKGVIVVFEPWNQISKARNTAAEHATGEWLIFLDADTMLNSDVLRHTIERLESGRVCGGSALMRFDRETGLVIKVITAIWNWASPRIGVAGGAFVYCSRDAWRAVDGFNETLYVAEDVSFSSRLKRWGRARGLRYVVITEAKLVTSS